MNITFTAVVKYITYYNSTNGYGVVKLTDGTTAVGFFPQLDPGDSIELAGAWTDHKKFGRQFKVENCEIIKSESDTGIIKILSSGVITGIGEKTAAEIVEKFGENTVSILNNSIDRLLEIKGIGRKKLAGIENSFELNKDLIDTALRLDKIGITFSQSKKIYKKFGKKALQKIEDNPYLLVDEFWGFGFITVDRIAGKLGIHPDDPKRIEAGIVSILINAARKGHVFLPHEKLSFECGNILGYQLAYSDPVLESLENNGMIVQNADRIYLSDYYYAEREIENRLENILDFNKRSLRLSKKHLNELKLKYSEVQFSAIKNSVSENILIITGGPGTGKTTTVKGIIELYSAEKKKVLLAAPTGRAAKRMEELIGKESKTIHRLLQYNPFEDYFFYNSENPLEADLIVIDEVSMIDTLLMYHMITALDISTTVVLVGDADQLPSVGPGNILRDLINSDKIKCVVLDEIFRQAEKSNITVAAHQINHGVLPTIITEGDTDFIFIEENDDDKVLEKILETVDSLPEIYGFDPLKDVQILSPMHKGICGVKNINFNFQKTTGFELLLKYNGKFYHKNDKVIQLKNNYTKNVFNGDIGFITRVSEIKKQLFIEFSGGIIPYNFDELDQLMTAYAISVHKSQGSEYPCVIMPIVLMHQFMLRRNLIYTAVTRASKLLILIGSRYVFEKGISNDSVDERFTSLFGLEV